VDLTLRDRVTEWLKAGWSPEIIAGRLQREARGKPVIHHETIYRWIYRYDRSLIKYLIRSHPRRYRRHQRRWPNRIIPRRISILQRPAFVNGRRQPGHWESDLVWGAGRSALQVLVERKTRFVFIRKTRNKSAQANYDALAEALVKVPAALRRTITYDNGVENTLHCELNERFDLQSFFCQPYHAWEKATVENTNGLIRRYFPKRTDFDTITPDQIQVIEARLNSRPRKCLNFKTAGEAYSLALRCT
jgi:IS30 family transposase